MSSTKKISSSSEQTKKNKKTDFLILPKKIEEPTNNTPSIKKNYENNQIWITQTLNNKNLSKENTHSKFVEHFKSIKSNNIFNTMDTIIVVFKIYSSLKQNDISYGVLFCEIQDNNSLPYYDKQCYSDGIIFKNISFGNSYISMDGEYRKNYIQYKTYKDIKRRYPSLWDDMENHVSYSYRRRYWSLFQYYFYPKLQQETKNTLIEINIKREQLGLQILILAWFSHIYTEYKGLAEINITETYKTIFSEYLEEDLKFFNILITKYSEAFITNIYTFLVYNYDPDYTYSIYRLGFKMIPMNIKEVIDPIKIKYKPWKEWLVTNRCSDLIINNIAPGFPIILNWFYIKSSKTKLYDNPSQTEKMKNSEIATEILDVLKEAQRSTHYTSLALNDREKLYKKGIDKHISTKFKKLDDKIQEPIDYAIETIIMSEVSLGFVIENLNYTYSDLFKIFKKNPQIYKEYGSIFEEENYKIFAKYIFEICYNLAALNIKLGIIHSDLHLGNVTLAKRFNLLFDNTEVIYESYTSIKDKTYLFEHNTYNSYIIDFSRAIVHPDKVHLLQDKTLPITHSIISESDKYKLSVIEELIKIFIEISPRYQNKIEELKVVFKNNFDLVFSIMSCLDIFMFTTRLLNHIQNLEFKTGTKCIALLKRLINISEMHIKTEISELIDNINYKNSKNDIHPMIQIIDKCFEEFESKEQKKLKCIFSLENELVNNIDTYDSLPNIYKEYKIQDENNKITENKTLEETFKKKYNLLQKEKLRHMEMLYYIASRHKLKYTS